MIHVVAVITSKPGMREQVLEHVRANVPAVKAEVGCIEYGPAIDATNAPPSQARYGDDTFLVIEKWATMENLQAHSAAPHMLAYGSKVKDMLADRKVHILQPAG